MALESVVRLEINKKVWSAIQNSEVLGVLFAFNPLIAGTFPLGIAREDSDVDVLIRSQKLGDFLQLFGKFLKNFLGTLRVPPILTRI